MTTQQYMKELARNVILLNLNNKGFYEMKILTEDEVCQKFGWIDYGHFLFNEDNMETRLFDIMSYVLELQD